MKKPTPDIKTKPFRSMTFEEKRGLGLDVRAMKTIQVVGAESLAHLAEFSAEQLRVWKKNCGPKTVALIRRVLRRHGLRLAKADAGSAAKMLEAITRSVAACYMQLGEVVSRVHHISNLLKNSRRR
jgi:hypothetical protein